MNKELIFQFKSGDSLAQFKFWLMSLTASIFVVPILYYLLDTFSFLAAILIAITIVYIGVLGLKASIAVSTGKVLISKSWFGIVYKSYQAEAIDDIWYGGDWGMPEGAICVVIKLHGSKKKITMGTRNNMHFLMDSLLPISRELVKMDNKAT